MNELNVPSCNNIMYNNINYYLEVPKKVMYNASHVNEVLHEAKEFGFSVSDVSFNWSKLKAYRDRYISRSA